MHPYRDSRITKAVLILFFIALAIYGFYEARGILFGPSISISQEIEEVSTPLVEISGTTTHIASLEMNGVSVPVTEDGTFDMPYALTPGYNRIVLDAKDKYGKSTERVIQIVYMPTNAAVAATTTVHTAATSTATSSIQ